MGRRELAAPAAAAGESLRGRLDHVVQQRALSRAADAAERDETPGGKSHVKLLEIVRMGAEDAAPAGRILHRPAPATQRMAQRLASEFSRWAIHRVWPAFSRDLPRRFPRPARPRRARDR